MTIDDVVLPLVGKDSSFPQHEIGEKIRERLKADGIDEMDEMDLKGNYRKVTVDVTDLKLIDFGDTTTTITFQLPSGSFATMMLRELLRRDTGGWEL